MSILPVPDAATKLMKTLMINSIKTGKVGTCRLWQIGLPENG